MSDVEVRADFRPLAAYIKRWTRVRMPAELRGHFNRVGAPAANAYRGHLPAKSANPHRSGDLRRSVRYRVWSKSTATHPLSVGIAVAPMGRYGRHRHLVEFGTRPHDIGTGAALYVAEQMAVMGADPGAARWRAFGMAKRIRSSGTDPAPYADKARAAALPRLLSGIDGAVQAAIDSAEG